MDQEDFKRILGNVLSNAIKYNNRGGTIDVKLQNNILSVQDNGIGIDINKQKNIFNRYYRATTQDGGFGLGLNIVYKICQEYAIDIKVDSQLKIGTTFYFDLDTLVDKNSY